MQTLRADTADIMLQPLGKDSTLLSKVRGAVGPVAHSPLVTTVQRKRDPHALVVPCNRNPRRCAAQWVSRQRWGGSPDFIRISMPTVRTCDMSLYLEHTQPFSAAQGAHQGRRHSYICPKRPGGQGTLRTLW